MRQRTVSLLVLIALLTAACGAEGGDQTTMAQDEPAATTTAAGQEEPDTTIAAPQTTATETETMDGVHVADTGLGEILVGPDGFTLYVFDSDIDGESTCYNACANLWPAVAADTPIGSDLDAAIFGSTARADGSEQLTINGMPLYRYGSDESPGDTMGQGVFGIWWVVDAQGDVVEAASDNEMVIDYGY